MTTYLFYATLCEISCIERLPFTLQISVEQYFSLCVLTRGIFSLTATETI